MTDQPMYGVVFDRPDPDRVYAWGPLGEATAARFAKFVTAEIDPAKVLPWTEATALPGVRHADPVKELLGWREAVAKQQDADNERLRLRVAELEEAAVKPTPTVTVYELRKGPDDDPHPLILGLYTVMQEAARHGEDEFRQAHGNGYTLEWFPDNCEDDAPWSLHAADDDQAEGEATEWHIVPRMAAGRFDADVEG